MAERLNVLYFVSHDTGRFLGCYGRPIPFSPNLDRFAAESAQFNQAYCAAPCCGPSRVCAMTGKYSHHTGTLGLGNMGWTLPADEPTLVDHFNDAGYQTMHLGFCHERLYGEMRYEIDGTTDDERLWKCDSRLAVNNAIELLQKRDRARPFYMNIATNETHASHFGGIHADRHGPPVPTDECWVPPTEPDLPEYRTRYGHWYASLRYMDGHFGRLMAALDDLQLRDNTLVIYTTDHGVGCQRGKRFVYAPGVEIALLMRPPKGIRTGYQVDHLTTNIDYLPTILEACGLAVPEGIDGRSFWPLLAGGTYTPREQLFIERNFHGEHPARGVKGFIDKYDPERTIRTREFAYVQHMNPDARPRPWYRHEIAGYDGTLGGEGFPLPVEDAPRPAEELYDLRHDPWEQQDVAQRPEYAAVKAELAGQLATWMRETNDPALAPGMPTPPQGQCYWPTRLHPIEVTRG